jgi:glycosyltransferase involved in cell wall biosynthesis
VTPPLISVMIGVYDAEPYIAEAIDSVFAQTYGGPIELIVADDGSTDGTAGVVRSYGDRVTYAHQENKGNGGARNLAVTLASGDYYAFLDADDRFVPDKLERQMAALDADPELDIAFGHVAEFVSPELDDETRARVRAPAPPQPWMAPNLMLIRRESFERVGPFSEELKVGVTVDWFARADEAGLRHAMLPGVVLERRLHTSNNGLRHADKRSQYVHVLKAARDRRRAMAAAAQDPGA